MNRKLRPVKSPYHVKNEQANFLLEDIEKNLEEYRKIIKTKDKQLPETKKILQGAKSSYSALTKENKQLKEYIEKIEQQYKQQQQQHQQQYFQQEQSYFKPKKYKKVVYEEASDSEPEAETEEIAPEKEIVEQEKEKATTTKLTTK